MKFFSGRTGVCELFKLNPPIENTNFYKEPFERWLIEYSGAVILEIFYDSIARIENFLLQLFKTNAEAP